MLQQRVEDTELYQNIKGDGIEILLIGESKSKSEISTNFLQENHKPVA